MTLRPSFFSFSLLLSRDERFPDGLDRDQRWRRRLERGDWTFDRIIGIFPSEQQPQITTVVADDEQVLWQRWR